MPRALERAVPGVAWMRRYRRRTLRSDVVAGLTVAVLLIPQGMAYAALAGMPPVNGLYAAMAGLVAYAAFGTSSRESVGPGALSALLTAAALGPLAVAESGRYVMLAGFVAVLAGLIRIALGAIQAGDLMNLVSGSVLTGFTAAAAVLIAASQLPDLLGAEVDRTTRFVDVLRGLYRGIGTVDAATAVLGTVCVAALFLLRRRLPVPEPLVVLALATVAVWALSLDREGVAVIGDVPPGLPLPTLPVIGAGEFGRVVPAALVLALVGYLEGIGSAKAMAARTHERIDANRELVAQGMVSVASGLFRGFPIGGSFSRTAVNHEAGARTQMSGLVVAAALAVSVLVLAPLFGLIPRAALAAIVIVAVVNLFDFQGILDALRTTKTDASALLTTFVATLVIGVETGFLVGVGLNLVLHLYGDMEPNFPELGRVDGTATYRNVDRYPVRTQSDVVILRLDAPLLFINAEAFVDRVNDLIGGREHVRGMVLDASALTDVDASGVHALRDLLRTAAASGVEVRLATVRSPVRDRLRRAHLWDLFEPLCRSDILSALESLAVRSRRLERRQPGEEAPDRVL